MSLGARIRHHRDQRGWTLETLSDRSGVDVGTISALENRDSERSKFAPQIARAFGLTVEQLLNDEAMDTQPGSRSPDYPGAPKPTAVAAHEPDAWTMRLTDAERDIVLAYRELLLKSDRDQFRNLILAKAGEARGIAAEVLRRFGANGVADNERVAKALPVRPDGPQPDTTPGALGPPESPPSNASKQVSAKKGAKS